MSTKEMSKKKRETFVPPPIDESVKPEKTGTQTLEYKQSILNGLVTHIEFTRGHLFPWHLDEIDAIERGLNTDLKKLVERSKHEEMDFKLAAMRRVIAVIERTNAEHPSKDHSDFSSPKKKKA